MGDDLFGTDNILRDIDDGLGAGQSTAAKPERAWLLRHTIQAINAHALHYICSQQQTDNDCAFHSDSDASETLTSTKHFRSSILIFQSKENKVMNTLQENLCHQSFKWQICFTKCFYTIQRCSGVILYIFDEQTV